MKIKALFDHIYFNAPINNIKDKRPIKIKHRVLQFFGLLAVKNALEIWDDKVNSVQILRNLAGWNLNYSTSRNILQALIIFPMNVFLTLCKLSLNILKLFTELLPFMLAKLSLILANYCKEGLISPKSKDTTDNEPLEENSLPFYVKKAGFALALLLAAPLTAAFHLLYFIGCATTSPADNVRSAFNTGDTLIKDVLPSKAKAGKRLGKVVGTFFALISMATTITVYAILFPLAIKLLMTQAPAVLPNIAHGIGNFMGLFSAQAGVSVTTFLTSTLPAFLSSFGATLAGAFTLTLSHMGITPLLVGIAGLFGLVVGAGITPLTAVADKIGEEFDPIKIQLHDQPAPFDGLVYQEAATQAKMGSLLQGYNVIKKKSITTQAEGQPVENDENVPLKEYTN